MDAAAPVVADAVSGVTGAGKKATERTHYCFANENLEAYGVGTHRHTPEIEQILGLEGRLVFTPHLAPLNRGLLSTVTLPLAPGAAPTTEELVELYRDFYAASPLVSVMDAGVQPRTASVAGTCRAQVGVAVHPAGMIVATGAIDNLGRARLARACSAPTSCRLPETCGLEEIANPVKLEGDEGRVGAVPWEREDL
ncbi:MAG: Asd/ArgC dimerization domain-containing protein [Adlercreutzia equolifaciens]